MVDELDSQTATMIASRTSVDEIDLHRRIAPPINKGPLPFRTGHCNTAELTADPKASHESCPWVAEVRGGWMYCPCDCHPQGHEANEQVADAIERATWKATTERDRIEERRAMAKTEKTETKSRKKAPAKQPKDCACECGGQTKGGEFLPGHDSKLKSRLQSEYREASTKAQRTKIAKQFSERGWDQFVPVLTDDE